MQTLRFPKPFDMHVHFRTGDMMHRVVKYTAQCFQKALVMPNTRPEAILAPEDVCQYRHEIMSCACGNLPFTPLMTFEIREDTNSEIIPLMKKAGAAAGKVYPKGLTTNADHGVADYFALTHVLAAMEKEDIPVCFHGEQPGDDIEGMERETEFVQRTLPFIVKTFRHLRIVMEHVTTEAAVNAVLSSPTNKLAATVTVHHLLLSQDDVGGDRCCPGNFCKPVAKRKRDRDAVVRAAVSGCPQFMFGSDSAPHLPRHKAQMYDCCAGVYSAPVALPLLAEVFEAHNALDRLETFVRINAATFHSEPCLTSHVVCMEKQPWRVPDDVDGIVPFWAGRDISWRIRGVDEHVS